jgi:hypothetical protein
MIASRENGPLLAMIVSLIIGIFGGYGPSLSTVKSGHLEWLWRICPGVRTFPLSRAALFLSPLDMVSEAYFYAHAHAQLLRHFYDVNAAAKWTGYTPNQLYLDFGYVCVQMFSL